MEQQVVQLPSYEQLGLVARIGERLSMLSLPTMENDRQRREYAAQVNVFLKLCDEMAAETIGVVNSVEDIHQIREERMLQLL